MIVSVQNLDKSQRRKFKMDCLECNKEFEPQGKKKKFCCKKCRNRNYMRTFMLKYQKTEKGKEIHKRAYTKYKKSEKGKAAQKRANNNYTEKKKLK